RVVFAAALRRSERRCSLALHAESTSRRRGYIFRTDSRPDRLGTEQRLVQRRLDSRRRVLARTGNCSPVEVSDEGREIAAANLDRAACVRSRGGAGAAFSFAFYRLGFMDA